MSVEGGAMTMQDLWRELPFSEPDDDSSQPCSDEAAGAAAEPALLQQPTVLQLDQFTYPDYQILPVDYVIRPSDLLLSLDSHSDYQGFMETMPMNYRLSSMSSAGSSNFGRRSESDEGDVKLAKRVSLIQHLPTGSYDGCRKNRECVICMIEFTMGDGVRFLPCMHTYHIECINNWLMRSFTCPSCMEPVDSALLTSYETN